MRDEFEFAEIDSLFANRLTTVLVTNIKYIVLKKSLNAAKKIYINYVNDAIKRHKFIKVDFVYYGVFAVKDREEEKTFNLPNEELCYTSNLDKWYLTKVVDALLTDIEQFSDWDSGWTMIGINNLLIQINKYNPIRVRSYIELPSWIKNKCAVINVKNNDDDCFVWAVLSAIFSLLDPKIIQIVFHIIKNIEII